MVSEVVEKAESRVSPKNPFEVDFDGIVLKYQNSLVNFVFRMVGNYETALDLTQEAFLKAYQSRARFDPHFAPSTWLFRIARNHTLDYLKKNRLDTIPIDPEVPFSLPRTPVRDNPEHILLSGESLEILDKSMAELSTDYREILLLRHAEGLSYDDIAQTLDLPLGTVKNRLFRAREILAKMMYD